MFIFFYGEHLVYFLKQTHTDYQPLAFVLKHQLNTYALIIKHLNSYTKKG